MMEALVREADSVREGIGRTVVRNLKAMARMGALLEEAVRHTYPQFPLRRGVLSWDQYLPPLSNTLRQLAERYDISALAQHTVAGSTTR
jgi:hypothetical protein